jgi:GntR family transcriptional regulator
VWTANSLPYLSPRSENQIDAWSDEAAQAGQVGTQKLRHVVEVIPPAHIAEALDLPAGDTAIIRSRLILLNGKPTELADSWYPASVAAGTALARDGKIKGGAVTYLDKLGYTAHEVREDISAREATYQEAAELQIPEHQTVIVLFRTVLNKDGVPFEASTMTMVAEGRHLRYRLMAG